MKIPSNTRYWMVHDSYMRGRRLLGICQSSPHRFTSVTMRGVHDQTATGRAVVTKRMCSSVRDPGVMDISDCLGEHVTLSGYLSSVYLSFCLSVHLSVCLCLSVPMSISVLICYLSVVCLSVNLSVSPSIHFSSAVCLLFLQACVICGLSRSRHSYGNDAERCRSYGCSTAIDR